MILFIDGPYGVGKTSVAKAVKAMCPKARVFELDALVCKWQNENPWIWFGDGTTPQSNTKIVKKYRNVIAENAREDDELYISDAALTTDCCKKELLEYFRGQGYTVKHVILMAKEDVIRERIMNDEKREKTFALENLKEQLLYIEKNMINEPLVETDGKSIRCIAEEVISIIQVKQ